MDENISWKVVIMAAVFSLFILGIAYYFISPQGSEYFSTEKTEKIAEFKNTRVEGRKEGKRVWEFFAKSGWTSQGQEITHLSEVYNGQIFKDGNLTVTNLSAPRAKAYRRTEVIEIFGPPVKARMDLGKFAPHPKDKKEWIRLTADSIKYSPAEKSSEMSGKITLAKKDFSILADKINVDHDKKIASIASPLEIRRKDGALKADSGQYLGETEELKAAGKVSFDLMDNKIRTIMKCNDASLSTDHEKDIRLSGSLEAVQGKKIAIAQEGTYSRQQRNLLLKGKAKAIFEKARAILKEKTVQKLHNPDTKKILKEKTVVTADEIVFSTKTSDAKASGNVIVTQREREAKTDAAVYDDKTEILTLTGHVAMQEKDGDWVNAQKIIVSIPKETFEAIGSVEAKFKL